MTFTDLERLKRECNPKPDCRLATRFRAHRGVDDSLFERGTFSAFFSLLCQKCVTFIYDHIHKTQSTPTRIVPEAIVDVNSTADARYT